MSGVRPFRRLMVANRGEIARRVIRSARRRGYETVALYSEADRDAPHVREADLAALLGPAPAAESYLDIERILAAARRTGADALHPGYGFLSENEGFARACEEAGLVFVGPTPDTIARMGSKIAAKELMVAHGVPVVPGFHQRGADDARIRAEALALGMPVLLKASAGGGGKGMRIVRDPSALDAAIAAARREARSAFGDDALLVERYVDAPRHIEVQIFGDAHGGLVHLFERECSIQRRHQKIIEETPAPGLSEPLREAILQAGLAAGRALGYRSAGTVEFVLAPDGSFYFLEVNTRLQVEHPVTEMVTGLDLVALQLDVASGAPLPFDQAGVTRSGHAIECRLYAEDPERDYLPGAGRIAAFDIPLGEGTRLDSGVESGSEVSIHYDPMLAKIVAHGADRLEAARRMRRTLASACVLGLRTNRELLIALVSDAEWLAGPVHTHWLAERQSAEAPADGRASAEDAAIFATLHRADLRAESRELLPGLPVAWRNNRWRDVEATWTVVAQTGGEAQHVEVRYRLLGAGRAQVQVDEASREARFGPAEGDERWLELDGLRRRFRIAESGDRTWVFDGRAAWELGWVSRFPDVDSADAHAGCVAPMPGKVLRVLVAEGDLIEAGAPVAIVEAMKMEHTLTAPARSRVTALLVNEGDQVAAGAQLVLLEPEDGDQA
ncbi:MAG: ATP-grasp domain-containing protein [Deltaproteobacteria bacterium]|nr:ATP-grasp domain-containing protein [Deltaproteobacteria bacterium]